MKIFNKIKDFFTSEKQSMSAKPDKPTYVQGYEENRQYFYSDYFRAKDIISYDDFRAAYKQHPTVFRCVHTLAKNVLKEGYNLSPIDEERGGKEANKQALMNYFEYGVHQFQDWYSVLYSSLIDYFLDAAKVIPIDPNTGWLYSNVDFGTLRPNVDKHGLFIEGKPNWYQIIDGVKVARFENEDCITLSMPDRTQFIFPESPLLPVLVNIETDLYGRQFNKDRFTNAAMFGAIFVLPDNANKQQAEKLLNFIRKEFVSEASNNSFGELNSKAYKPIVLFGGTQVNTGIAETFKDIDFLKLRKTTKEEIMEVYEINPRVMGIETSGLGQAGANDTAMQQFYNDVIIPHQKCIEKQITKQLIQNRFKIYDYKFEFIRPKWINLSNEITNHAQMVQAGIETTDEARYNLKEFFPVLEGEKNSNVEWVDEEPEQEQAPEPTEKTEEQPEELNKKSLSEELNNVRNILLSYKPIKCCDEDKTDINDIDSERATKNVRMVEWDYKRATETLDSQEEDLISEVDEILQKMANDVQKQVLPMVQDGNSKGIKDLKLKYVNELEKVYKVSAEDTFEKGKEDFRITLKKRITIDSFMSGSKITQWIKNQAAISASKQAAAFLGDLKVELMQAIKQGKSDNEVVGIVQGTFEKHKNKTPAIVRTTTTSFYNEGHAQQQYQVKEFAPKVQYSAIMDDRTSARCERLNGMIVEVDSPLFEDIRPPQHINCRSLMIPVTVEDIAADPESFKTTPPSKVETAVANTPGFKLTPF